MVYAHCWRLELKARKREAHRLSIRLLHPRLSAAGRKKQKIGAQ
jgi:hypothetical protein